jgi:hypothetical protein
MPARPQKITFAEMRAAGVRGLLIYCADFSAKHTTAAFGREALPSRSRERDPDEGVRASDTHRNSALVPLGKCYDERCGLDRWPS